jgi:bifunctional non-homologous end joining protein LigD
MKALRDSSKALRFSEHLEGDGPEIYRPACALGLEGIVSTRRDLSYRSGRSAAWLKIRNPNYERGGSVLTTRSHHGQSCSS